MPNTGSLLQTPASPGSQIIGGEALPATPKPPRPRKVVPRSKTKSRGKNCKWTPELDEILRDAWARGRLRAARRAIRKEQPTWSSSSIRRRAAALGLCRRRAAQWSDADEHHLLWSIDSNASLSLIAQRLGRSVAAIRKRLWFLGYKAESLGGYKVKEVAEMLGVTPGRVEYWVEARLLFTKGGRITDSSLSKLLTESPEKIPFATLSPEMQAWLCEMGYAAEPKTSMASSSDTS